MQLKIEKKFIVYVSVFDNNSSTYWWKGKVEGA